MLRIKELQPLQYICGDLNPENYIPISPMSKLDITNLPFEDNFFDLIICNHVLEHVPNDALAMRELHRVLGVGGVAILQTPFSWKLKHTREGIPAATDDERIMLYGQRDHVRIYNMHDYTDRLERCGYEVETFDCYEFDAERAFLCELDPFELLIAARKADPTATQDVR